MCKLKHEYLELDGTHTATNKEKIVFANRPVGLQKVRLQKRL